jgi:hypothetical protein
MWDVHEPQSIAPAPGWRAAFVYADGSVGCQDLVVWAVCTDPDDPVDARNGRQVHGYVHQGGDIIGCAEEADNFWKYVGPADRDPTPEEAAQDARAQIELMRAVDSSPEGKEKSHD